MPAWPLPAPAQPARSLAAPQAPRSPEPKARSPGASAPEPSARASARGARAGGAGASAPAPPAPIPERLERKPDVARDLLAERVVRGQRTRIEEEPVAPHEPLVHVDGQRHLDRPGDAGGVRLDHDRLIELQLKVQLEIQEDVEGLRAGAGVERAAHADARVARPVRMLIAERLVRGLPVVRPVDLQPQLTVAPRRPLAFQQADHAAVQRQIHEHRPRLEHPALAATLLVPVTRAVVVIVAPAPEHGRGA